MKLINKIFMLTGLMIVLNACSLDEEPYGFLSTSNFYKSESDAMSALANCYDALPTNEYYGRYLYYLASLGTEEFSLKPDAQPADHELDKWNVLTTNENLEGVFFNAYMGINRTNMLIKHVPNIAMDETKKNQILGEAMFLRALHNFNLVRLFGSVPLRKEAVVSADAIPAARASLADIYAFIEEDLLAAEEKMAANIQNGRANKVAAQALLAKVYLQLASASASGVAQYDFVGSTDYYAKAALYAEKVLTNDAGFRFWTDDIKALWDVDNQVGNEFIFSVAFNRVGGISEGDFSKFSMLQVPYVNGTKIKLGPDFTVEIPDGWNHLQTETPFFNSFDPADNRKNDLIVSHVKIGTTDYTFPGGGLQYPFTRKYIDKNQAGDQTSHYVSVIRYSDIMLVYAEALGAKPEAYGWVNMIRTRAGLDDLEEGLSDADFRAAVVKERSFELAFEGNRLFDLRRTKTVESVLEGEYGKEVNPANAYFYPIPQAELDNNPLID
ncbi:RagB/SusD family nutrient uptake outer membrane protein [Pseudochryseolinea flava]|uniref:RagB/SusD family nutrient uptake outer membrane protein n=1 Tax=Pseudochryseolinea flava TaxID=2059302 RepID=A0A364XYD8_9BACT|nr:RagB/SusD family nutrient uptake outer membrane protein [Pseudochryseolinea flava]RAV99456.1 RagB/SusD family nutrient uptake outer membrane protein [Pseudochryseolinea flava]